MIKPKIYSNLWVEKLCLIKWKTNSLLSVILINTFNYQNYLVKQLGSTASKTEAGLFMPHG